MEVIEVSVGAYQEKSATLTVHGLGGQGTVSHCQIVLSALTVFHPRPINPDFPIVIGYYNPVTGEFVRTENTAGDPEKILIDARITAARMSPTPNTSQEATFGPGASSVSLANATSVSFLLHVKTSTNEPVYARASVSVHTT
jgi:hypothetical protein